MAHTRTRTTADGKTRYTGLYYDPLGKQRSAGTFAKRKAALIAAQESEAAIRAGRWIDPDVAGIDFTTFVERVFLPHREAGVVSRSTAVDNRSTLRTHLVPFFGDTPMSDVQPYHVQMWVTDRLKANVKAGRLRKAHNLLHTIFESAIYNGVRHDNPANHQRGQLPKVTERAVTVLPETLVPRLYEALSGQHRLMVELMLDETGMRWSEVVGLRVRRIDFLRRLIRVEEVCVERSERGGERWHFGPPKDHQTRDLTISADALAHLAAHIQTEGLGADDLVFGEWTRPSATLAPSATATARAWARSSGHQVGTHGRLRPEIWAAYRAHLVASPTPEAERAPQPERRPHSHSGFRRAWKAAVQSIGRPDLNVQHLRHTHATWLLSGGLSLREVQERLGHSVIETTQRYLHALPDMQQRAVETLAERRRRRADLPA